MKNESDFIWGMFKEHSDFARHHEVQRSMLSNIIIILSGGLFALITYDRIISEDDIILSFFILIIGLYGAVFSSKQYERTVFHMNRARIYRLMLEELYPGLKIDKHRVMANSEHISKFDLTSRIPLNKLWIGLNLTITLAGLIIIIMAILL